MRIFELNGLGKDWCFEAETEEKATCELIKQICGAKTIEEYQEYCKEVGVDDSIEWFEHVSTK